MKRTTSNQIGYCFAAGKAAQNSNGQLYTDGRVIFSYGPHWPLAAWIDGRLHVNDDRFSPTTSKHRSFALRGVTERQWNEAKHYMLTKDMILACKAAGLM